VAWPTSGHGFRRSAPGRPSPRPPSASSTARSSSELRRSRCPSRPCAPVLLDRLHLLVEYTLLRLLHLLFTRDWMRRSTWSLSTSISRIPAMRLRRSSGETISSRFCFRRRRRAGARRSCRRACPGRRPDGGNHGVVCRLSRASRTARTATRPGHRRLDVAAVPSAWPAPSRRRGRTLVFLPLDGARAIDPSTAP